MQGGEDPWGPHDDADAVDDMGDDELPPVPPARAWQHPSEVGRQNLVQADRRRGRWLALTLVGVGVGLVAASVVVQLMSPDSVDGDDQMVAASYADGVVHVERLDSDEDSGVVGLLLDDEGHVVVPMHAVGTAPVVRVLCNGSYTTAEVLAADPHSDLAVLQLESWGGPTARLTAAPPTGRSLRLVTLDDRGNRVVRDVVVSERDAEAVRANGTIARDVLRAEGTAASSGVLVNSSQEVVGWVVAEQTRDGSGAGDTVVAYASLPLRRMVLEMLDSGTPPQSWIGVKVDTAAASLAESGPGGTGVSVHGVEPSGPAAAAGVLPGDVIVSVDDRPVRDHKDLVALMEATAPGTEVSIGIVRDGALYSLPVTTGVFGG